ncbi:MAG: hypothetical protein KDA85_03710 [Planctomycetaceae bacterium]|nr:hypothetical protein [Planctomycetaceae bacterium]
MAPGAASATAYRPTDECFGMHLPSPFRISTESTDGGPVPKLLAVRLFLHSFLISLGYLATRALADGILLARIGPDTLPAVMLVSLPVVSLISFGWSYWSGKGTLIGGIGLTRVLLATSTAVISFLLMSLPDHWTVIISLYLLAEVRGVLNTTQLATLLNEVVRHKDRRCIPIAFAGAPAAGITCGLLIGSELADFHTTQLLQLISVADLLAVLILAGIRRASEQLPDTSPARDSVRRSFSATNVRRLARLLPFVMILQVLVLSFVAFEWRIAVAHLFDSDERRITAYFAHFYAGCDVITLLLQLTIANRIVDRYGLRTTLLILPVSLALILPAGLFLQHVHVLFAVMTVARSTEVLRRGLYEQGLVRLYQPIPLMIRRRLISFVNGLVKPAAEWMGVLAINAISLTGNEDFRFNSIAVGLALMWVWVVWRVCRQFQRCNEFSLPDTAEPAPATRSALSTLSAQPTKSDNDEH